MKKRDRKPQKVKQYPPKTQSSSVVIEAEYQGLLPLPSHFERYEKACPGAAKEIISMTVTQAKHRQDQENKLVNARIAEAKRGHYTGFFIAIAFLVSSVYLIRSGHELAGGILGTIDILALVVAFINGRK